MERDLNIIIGERVRSSRLAAGLSLQQLVGVLDFSITLQQLARYERGLSRWPVDLLCDVCRALNADITVLTAQEE